MDPIYFLINLIFLINYIYIYIFVFYFIKFKIKLINKIDEKIQLLLIQKKMLTVKIMTKYITISEIYSKIRSKEDIINYFREQGKPYYII